MMLPIRFFRNFYVDWNVALEILKNILFLIQSPNWNSCRFKISSKLITTNEFYLSILKLNISTHIKVPRKCI